MELNANCGGCGAAWRLVAGVDTIPEDDPKVKDCPHCHPVGKLANVLNVTDCFEKYTKKILEAGKVWTDKCFDVARAKQRSAECMEQFVSRTANLDEPGPPPMDVGHVGVDVAAPEGDRSVSFVVPADFGAQRLPGDPEPGAIL